MHKAVFLDRDGTIVHDVGFMNSPDQIIFFPGSISAIKKLTEAGFKVFIITNQGGVARGLIREDVLQSIDKTIQKHVLNGGGIIDSVYYCPHHADHGYYPYRQVCECRKPKPGMILKAAKDHNIDLNNSWMIGDKRTDIYAGKNAGTKTMLVMTGRGKEEKPKLEQQPDAYADDLLKAVNHICK